MDFVLPEEVKYIIDSLAEHGYRADIVGGSVRDILLGKRPDDYDITTDATPDQIKSVFQSERTVDTGLKHGTVSIIIDGRAYEVTTYRVDGEYKDSRHPESVFFTRNITEDLARRDFTVNAMAYSPYHGLTDPYGGRADLENGVIRAVGDPYRRFGEDALRILRGVRFCASLGFNIEKESAAALREKKQLLRNVSAERIYVELKKTFAAPFAFTAINSFSDVICEVIPTLEDVLLPDEELFNKADYLSRFVSVFYLSSQSPAADFDTACRALRTDNHIRETGGILLSSIGKYDGESDRSLTYALRDIGKDNTEALLRLELLLGKVKPAAIERLKRLLLKTPCYSIADLKVNGGDMLAIGLRGRAIGYALESLLSAVIDGRVENERLALIAFVSKTTGTKI